MFKFIEIYFFFNPEYADFNQATKSYLEVKYFHCLGSKKLFFETYLIK
jgi:hypothetical protein